MATAGDAGRASIGRLVGLVVVLQHDYDRQRVGHRQRRILAPLRLAMQIPHGAGVALGQPSIEPIPVRDRLGVGDSACEETELGGMRLDQRGEAHGDAVGTPPGRIGAAGVSTSPVMSRAPR